MALGQYEKLKRTFLNISYGKVVAGSKKEKQYYNFVEGALRSIYAKNSQYGLRWYLDLVDDGQIYSVCLPYRSGVMKSIALSLASFDELTTSTRIKIEPYEGINGYTRVNVYADGKKLDWITKDIPLQEFKTIAGETIKDDTKQMEFIEQLINTIKSRLDFTD